MEWEPTPAAQGAASGRRDGWNVAVECENGGRAYRAIRTSVPDAVVLDLRTQPSHGREVGGALRGLRATRDVPILCIEDGAAAREATRAKIPDALFVPETDLVGSLAEIARERARPARVERPAMKSRNMM
ncbi:MAG: hypothetical protein NVSMB47_13410 [Polyangiales bacterium]